jgi:hypothetical protein
VTKESKKIMRELMLELIALNPGKFNNDELTAEILKIAATNPKVKQALAIENQDTWRLENR